MATYSDRLRLELMTTGEFSGTWGDRTNVNMGTILEQAIAGLKTITMTDADKTLVTATGNAVTQGTDYTDDEARYAILSVESSEDLTGSRNLIIPAKEKIYIVKNGTSGSQQITVKTSTGTGVAIPNGKTMVIYCDATNTQSAVDNFPSGTTIAGSEIATTTTGQTITNKTIQSSTVDSSAIGATTASTGAFTTLTSSSTTTLNDTTIPASKTLVDTDSTQTLTNKTITSPVINEIVHEGTADDFETTIAFTDPTADRTITFPNSDGTVSLSDTTYTAGTGLTLTGTEFDVNVSSTEQTTAAETVTSTTNRTYAVQVDSSDNLVVNVPWVDTDTQNTYSAGTGLELTGSTFSVNLGTTTQNTATQASLGTEDGRTYLVQTDGDGDLVVNVPWENTEGTDTTYSSGTGLTLDGSNTFNVNVEGTVSSATPETVTTTADRTYQVQHNSSDNLVVNVPWSDNNTEYSTATSSTLGLVKLGSDTEQATAAESVTSTSSRTYAVQVNSSDQLVVNVPWSNTDTDTTYTAGTGLSLSADNEFSADFDGAFSSLTGVPSVLANATNTSLTFEGSTVDDNETVLNISNPTADRTITFPDDTGTVALTKDFGTISSQNADSVDIDGGAIDGVTIGTNSAVSDLRVDYLKLDGQTLSTTNTNGSLRFDADGSGSYLFGVAKDAATPPEVIIGINDAISGDTTQSTSPAVLTIQNLTGGTTGELKLGKIQFKGYKNNGASEEVYAHIIATALDNSSNSCKGSLYISTTASGLIDQPGGLNLAEPGSNCGVFLNFTTDWSSVFAYKTNDLRNFYEARPDSISHNFYGGISTTHNFMALNARREDEDNTLDVGIVFHRDDGVATPVFYWDESTDKFVTRFASTTFGASGTANTDTIADTNSLVAMQVGAFQASSLTLANGATVDLIRDEDNMASNDASSLATQQSIKAYVDSKSVSNTSGSAPLYGARAWGTFDGTDYTGASSPYTVSLSNFTTGNISSINRTGTGQYTINFTTALPNSTYTFIGTVNLNTPQGGGRELLFYATSQSTSSVTVECKREETEAFVDGEVLSFVIFAG